jgi:hypothetical protein
MNLKNSGFYHSIVARWTNAMTINTVRSWGCLLDAISGMKTLGCFCGLSSEDKENLELLWDIALERMPLDI